ncbi:uncharacterized protein [Arachis hypogaea]|uniref:uncharacterized protein n=1 Tax=Arachis hypogaea TaxID=3818 RepID=UPI000DECEFA3|nr:uncharacterized protein LOC112794480 [Arachis hypogaea]QHO10208.1 uncharacterized protein DS421_14g487860 [Arachis hypogaea]
MASPPEPPPPPPPELPPPPPDGEGLFESLDPSLGIKPESMASLYFKDLDTCGSEMRDMVMQVEPHKRADAMLAILEGYFKVRHYIYNRIMQGEIEVAALEHRLENSRQLAELSKSVTESESEASTLPSVNTKQLPAGSSTPLHSLPGYAETMKALEEDDPVPELGEVANSLYFRALRTRLPFGITRYYENQMKEDEIELDAARRALREFRIMDDLQDHVIHESYHSGNPEIIHGADARIEQFGDTMQEQNATKDKGKKIQNPPKDNAGK